jgi:hypothetical protein
MSPDRRLDEQVLVRSFRGRWLRVGGMSSRALMEQSGDGLAPTGLDRECLVVRRDLPLQGLVQRAITGWGRGVSKA